MNKLCIVSIIILSVSLSLTAQWTTWQTTHEGSSSGVCHLESNSINVTIHSLSVDIEEEAILTATPGSWFSGDSSTLEITGTMRLTPGTAVRSLLLWNGNTILKAKLKDKRSADSAYEAVIDRDKPVVVVRDPALIEYLGNNSYRFKIYPVKLSESRRIRILYTVALSPCSAHIGFDINTAFINGIWSSDRASSIPIEIHIDPNNDRTYFIETNGTKRNVQSGGTYIISTPSRLCITGESITAPYAESYSISEGPQVGNYIALMLPVRNLFDSLLHRDEFRTTISAIEEKLNIQESTDADAELENYVKNNYALEATINAGDRHYIIDVSNKIALTTFIKSISEWDNVVSWSLYNPDGERCLMINDTVPIVAGDAGTPMLPLLWAAKYTLKENKGNLGATYGFVDMRMSLLALESDSIPADETADWEQGGVPPLLPKEIITGSTGAPCPPEESVLFEYSTPITVPATDYTRTMILSIFPGNLIRIKLGSHATTNGWTVMLFDLQGRSIFRQNNLNPEYELLSIQLPRMLKGTFCVRLLHNGNVGLSRKIILR